MPTRHTITSRCVHLEDGTRLIVEIPPPRSVMTFPDPYPVRAGRRWRCRWLLLRRRLRRAWPLP